MKQEAAKFLLDLAKILFGTTFLGAIISETANKTGLWIISLVVMVIFTSIAFLILKNTKK